MLGNKFSARLNSFASKSESFWSAKSELNTIDLINRAATVKGLTDVDLNYPDHLEEDFNNTINYLAEKELNINGYAMRYYNNPQFKLGAFTNPNKKIRQEAIDLTKRGIDLARKAKCKLMTIWLGQDGFDYSFQVDYKKILEDEINGIHEVASYDKECMISIEYKPNEPRAYSLLPNLTSTLLAIKEINLPNIGVTLDFAHMLYANELPAFSASIVSKHSKILGLHLNDAYGKRDDGMMVGSVHQLATIEFLYQLEKNGFTGPIYFDTFPDVIDLDPVRECEANIQTTKKMLKLVKKLLKDNELSEAIDNQDTIKSYKIINETLYSSSE